MRSLRPARMLLAVLLIAGVHPPSAAATGLPSPAGSMQTRPAAGSAPTSSATAGSTSASSATASSATAGSTSAGAVPTADSTRTPTEPPAEQARTNAETLEVHVAQMTPTIALPRQPVTFTVQITNRSDSLKRGIVLRIRSGDRSLRTREEIRRWDAEGGTTADLRTLVEQPVPGSLAPGSTARLAVVVPAAPLPSDPYGAAPLELQAQVGAAVINRRTFLPYFRIKEYTPLDIAFAAPLTGDANPALYSTSPQDRTSAWTEMLGSNGRLTRLVNGTADAPVTWVVDPAVVGAGTAPDEPGPTAPAGASPDLSPGQSPNGTATTPPSPGGGATAPPGTTSNSGEEPADADEVTRLQAGLLAKIRTGQPRRPVWQLPTGDPDLSALVIQPHTGSLLHRLAAPEPGVQVLGADVPRVAWPLPGQLNESQRNTITAAYGAAPPVAFLAPITALTGNHGTQASAPHQDASGRAMLGYDEELSRLWGTLREPATAAETTHRFLAESAALLAQSPSRSRSVLVVAPRLIDPDPAAHKAFFEVITATPWLRTVSTQTLLNLAAPGGGPGSPPSPSTPTPAAGTTSAPAATPTPAAASTLATAPTPAATSAPAATPMPTATSPARTAPSPTTAHAAEASAGPASPAANGSNGAHPSHSPEPPLASLTPGVIDEQHRALVGLGSVLAEPAAAVLALQAGNDALASTVWRYDPAAWARLETAEREGIHRLTTGISVRASTVNFFADSGVLQLTVVNDLDQDVRDLTVTLNPEGRASRLRILRQPDPVRIRKNSRTTVRAAVEAIAAGAVPVSTRLTTPAGTTLGTDATVRVTVQPTNGWAALAVGGLAGVVFLAGLYRTLRGGKPRMTSEELNRIDLT